MAETDQEKIARAQELMRQAFAILNSLQPGNIRPQHDENLALLAGHPAPSKLPEVGPPLVALPEPAEEVE